MLPAERLGRIFDALVRGGAAPHTPGGSWSGEPAAGRPAGSARPSHRGGAAGRGPARVSGSDRGRPPGPVLEQAFE